jgi:lysophospholipase L1-like esterase
VSTGLASVLVNLGAVLGVRPAVKRRAAISTIIDNALPVHSKWWREHAKEEGELLYVALGDSAAQGIGASSPHLSYVGVIADEIRLLTGRTVRVVNLSVSGATVATAVADQLPAFRKLRPDFVTVAIGANDIAAFDAGRFETRIRELLAALPRNAVVADMPYFFLPWNEKKVAVANRILRTVAAELELTVVPLHETMKHQGVRGVLTQFAIDLFHPNDHGYRVWASAFLPTVTASIVERYPTPPVTPVTAS